MKSYFSNGVQLSAAGGMALTQKPKSLSCDSIFGVCQSLNQSYFSTVYTSSHMGSSGYGSFGSSDKSLQSLDLQHNSLQLSTLLKTGNLPCNSLTRSEQDTKCEMCCFQNSKRSAKYCTSFLVVKGASCKMPILWKGCYNMFNITAPLKMSLIHQASRQGLGPTMWNTYAFSKSLAYLLFHALLV